LKNGWSAIDIIRAAPEDTAQLALASLVREGVRAFRDYQEKTVVSYFDKLKNLSRSERSDTDTDRVLLKDWQNGW
jgi:hypothetical protein